MREQSEQDHELTPKYHEWHPFKRSKNLLERMKKLVEEQEDEKIIGFSTTTKKVPSVIRSTPVTTRMEQRQFSSGTTPWRMTPDISLADSEIEPEEREQDGERDGCSKTDEGRE